MTSNRHYRGALVIAAPSLMGAWALEIFREAAAVADPPLNFQILDSLGVIDPAEAPRTIYVAQFPSDSVLSIVNDGRLPVIAFVDGAIDAITYLRRKFGCTFGEALRIATSGAVVNPFLFRGLATIVFYRNSSIAPSRILDRVFTHLALPLSLEKQDNLMLKYCVAKGDSQNLEASIARCDADYQPIGKWDDVLKDEERSIAEQVLGPLVRMSLSEDFQPVIWPCSLFMSGDPNKTAPRVAEMTGAARYIYYGPYLYLPPSYWGAEFVISFSREVVGSTFTVEVGCSTPAGVPTQIIARARFRASDAGLFRGTFMFAHSKPQERIDMRFKNDKGAIEGRFGLDSVKLYYRDRHRHNVA